MKSKEKMSIGGQGRFSQGKETFPTLQTRDIVAEKLGFKSGREVERAMGAVRKILAEKQTRHCRV